MARHRAAAAAHASRNRLRGRQPGQLDAPLPRARAPARGDDGSGSSRMTLRIVRYAAAALALAFSAAAAAQNAGDATRGTRVFQACAACHSLEPKRNLTGPTLSGVLGRKAGALESFARYSEALKKSGIVWNEHALDAWIANPEKA